MIPGKFQLLLEQLVSLFDGLARELNALAARSDYIEINGRRYPRTPVALSDYPVSDGGGSHALWGDPEREEVKGRADSTAAPSADASVQTPQAG